MESGSLDSRLTVAFFHLGLALDCVQIRGMEAGGDVEIRPELGFQLQPVFILAVDIVDKGILLYGLNPYVRSVRPNSSVP